MKVSVYFAVNSLLLLTGINVISTSPAGNTLEDQKENVTSQTTSSVADVASSTVNITSGFDDEENEIASTPSEMVSPTQSPDLELSSSESLPDNDVVASTEKMKQSTIVIVHPPANESLFAGLRESVSQAYLGGIIMEAFKIAKVSIALFAQSLAGQVTGGTTILSVANTTKLVENTNLFTYPG